MNLTLFLEDSKGKNTLNYLLVDFLCFALFLAHRYPVFFFFFFCYFFGNFVGGLFRVQVALRPRVGSS